MLRSVLRWGQSAYETDLDLGLERVGAEALELSWRAAPTSPEPPSLEGIGALVVTSKVRVTEAVLDRFEGSLVLTTTSGTDHIDLEAAAQRGIAVGRCPLARRDPVVEHALGSMIGLLRRQPSFQRAAESGHWVRRSLPDLGPRLLGGAPVLVVGLGVIGRRMAEVLSALGAEVWGVDPAGVPDAVHAVDLHDALPHVVAVTVHADLNPTSHHLLSRDLIARLPPHAVLVHTSRGPVVDVDAAVAAVHEGRLAGVHLDVFPEEPWPGLREAATHPAVWLSPHASGFVHDLGERVAREVIESLRAWNAGAPPPHPVFPRQES